MEYPADLVPLPTMPYDQRPSELPLDVEECRTALWLARGNVSKAAERLKVSPQRLRNFVRATPRLAAECDEAREQIADMAEDVVVEALQDVADPARQDAMARFALTHLGGNRGYGNGKGGVNINLPKSGKVEISWADGSTITRNDESDIIDVTPQAAE